MSLIGWLIIAVSAALTALIAIATHGHVLFVCLPLLFGLPLAGAVGRRKRR